eukprot:scaffold10310_cov171-Amphora_coffeaeformis.AAC.4
MAPDRILSEPSCRPAESGGSCRRYRCVGQSSMQYYGRCLMLLLLTTKWSSRSACWIVTVTLTCYSRGRPTNMIRRPSSSR